MSGVALDAAAEIALRLPDAHEADHHGRRSFRVDGRIFATLWDATHMNVMLDEPGIRSAVAAHPDVCAERWWGRRLAAASVDLERVDPGLLAELLADAWECRAGRPGPSGPAPQPARRPPVSPPPA